MEPNSPEVRLFSHRRYTMTIHRYVTLISMRKFPLVLRQISHAATAILVSLGLIVSSQPAQALDLGPSSMYLVRVTPEAKAAIEKSLTQYGGQVNARYQYVFDGFLVKLPDIAVTALKKLSTIITIEKDAPVQMSAIQNYQSPTPSWGLDRVDQRERVGTNSSYGFRSAGTGSTVYVVDTGVFAHNDFVERLSTSGFSAISDGNGAVDCNGHGTHVAGTIAGTQYGLAKNAKIVPVRVLGCNGSGTYSQVIAGMEWILSPNNPNSKSQAVVNMSLGGGASPTIDAAVTKLTNSGIVTVVAAGNSNADACNYSPARATSAITVGATDRSDNKSSFSNWGSCVDIHAPGSSIASAWIGTPSQINTISGTSMASPHVAGAAAIYLGLNPNASVAQVAQFLDTQATVGAIGGLPAATVNELLYISPTDNLPSIVPPTIALRTVSAITHESAQITVDVNPGFAPTDISLQYSIDPAMNSGLTSTPFTPAQVSGGDLVQASAKVGGLTPTKTYYFRLSGTNESGTSTSQIGNFKTLAPPKAMPVASVIQPTAITAYSATLQGSVNPGNDETSVSFIYGTDATFKLNSKTGLSTPATISGGNPVAVSLPIAFLEGGITYYVKVLATNSTGTVSSETITFETPKSLGKPPIVTTKPNGYLFSTTKENPVQGTVNPQGQTTVVTLSYGPDSTFSSNTRSINIGTFTGDTELLVTGNMPAAPTPGARVWYRFEATNASGITRSTAQSNGAEKLIPVITSQRFNNSVASQVTLSATGDARGSNTRWSFIYGTTQELYTTSSSGAITLAPGAIAVKGNPEARAVAGTFTTSAIITGLKNGTRYYFATKVDSVSSSDPGAGRPVMGATQTWETLNVSPTPTPTATPTPTQTPTPTPTSSPAPSPTPTPTPGVKQPQTISFPALLDRFFNEPGTALLATSTSRLPVTYTTSTPTLCQILDLGGGKFTVQPRYTLAGTETMTCSFTANQSGSSSFLAAEPVTRTLKFNRQNSRITIIAPTTVPLTGSFLLASVNSTEGRSSFELKGISFTSATPTICTVSEYSEEDSRGPRVTVRPRNNGTCQVAITFPGSGNLKPASSTWSFAVTGINSPLPGSNAAQSIEFPTLVNAQVGKSQQLLAKATSGLQITYMSMTPDVCMVLYPTAGPAVQSVNARPEGNQWTCTIRASQAGDDRFAPAPSVERSFTYAKIPMVLAVQNAPTLKGAGPHRVTTSVRMVDAASMSGISSLGHLLTAQSLTPTVCKVNSNELISPRGGVFNLSMVALLSSGTCTLKLDFGGTKDRAPATVTWNAAASLS